MSTPSKEAIAERKTRECAIALWNDETDSRAGTILSFIQSAIEEDQRNFVCGNCGARPRRDKTWAEKRSTASADRICYDPLCEIHNAQPHNEND